MRAAESAAPRTPPSPEAEFEAVVAAGIVARGDVAESRPAIFRSAPPTPRRVGHDLGRGDDEEVARREAEADEDADHRVGYGRSRGPRVDADRRHGGAEPRREERRSPAKAMAAAPARTMSARPTVPGRSDSSSPPCGEDLAPARGGEDEAGGGRADLGRRGQGCRRSRGGASGSPTGEARCGVADHGHS